MRQYKYRDAFWQAAPHVSHDADCRDVFLRICLLKSSLRDVYDDIDKVREMADEGNPYMQYAYARLHDYFPFTEDSLQTCVKYYEDAADNGIADASACLAWLEAAGAFGEKNLVTYHDMIDKAMAKGSRHAAFLKLKQVFVIAAAGVDDESVHPVIEEATKSPLLAACAFVAVCKQHLIARFLAHGGYALEQERRKRAADVAYDAADKHRPAGFEPLRRTVCVIVERLDRCGYLFLGLRRHVLILAVEEA